MQLDSLLVEDCKVDQADNSLGLEEQNVPRSDSNAAAHADSETRITPTRATRMKPQLLVLRLSRVTKVMADQPRKFRNRNDTAYMPVSVIIIIIIYYRTSKVAYSNW